jgi:hypothetical protein
MKAPVFEERGKIFIVILSTKILTLIALRSDPRLYLNSDTARDLFPSVIT